MIESGQSFLNLFDGGSADVPFRVLANFIRDHEVGRRAFIETPVGRRLLYYGDLTATGRSLHLVELFMRRILPFYANTHTDVSSTGRITGQLRERAREVVRQGTGAGPTESDLVLFTGAGATAAVNKLVGLLGVRLPEPLERRFQLSSHIPEGARPVVLVGPMEHHSNLLPWRETVCTVVEVGWNEATCNLDLDELDRRCREFADRPLRIGTFSAGSNVTGQLTDTHAVARVLHQHNFFAVFDYAGCGPYVPIRMHVTDEETGEEDADARLDAIFVSPHKFMGGPGGSGVLVVNRAMVDSAVPERPGGGTVDYVAQFSPTEMIVNYTAHLEEREEGGTPNILGDIRTGVAFLVKDLIGAEAIREHEIDIARRAFERLDVHPRIRMLGPQPAAVDRLAILSFNIDGLHHDMASALLDHLFGVQNRAGCACAGPFGHRLLGIDEQQSLRLRRLIEHGLGGLKPGWVRLSLPYFATDADLEFVLSAVEFVADHGETFLCSYSLNWRDGVWRHLEKPQPDFQPVELTSAALLEAAQSFAVGDHEAPITEREVEAERRRYFVEAEAEAKRLRERFGCDMTKWKRSTGVEKVDELVWFKFVHASEFPAGIVDGGQPAPASAAMEKSGAKHKHKSESKSKSKSTSKSKSKSSSKSKPHKHRSSKSNGGMA